MPPLADLLQAGGQGRQHCPGPGAQENRLNDCTWNQSLKMTEERETVWVGKWAMHHLGTK